MAETFNNPIRSFNTNLNSPIVGFDGVNIAPESGTGPITFPNPIIAYNGQVKAQG
jgi:hypothetical protein